MDGDQLREIISIDDLRERIGTYQSVQFDDMMSELARRHPELDFECLIAEGVDAVSLVQSGRAHLALVPELPGGYPPDLGSSATSDPAEFAVYAARNHELTKATSLTKAELSRSRELRLCTISRHWGGSAQPPGTWCAPSYLMLMDMAEAGCGWATLPTWLVARYARSLVPLSAAGWPQRLEINVVWSRVRVLGPVAQWVIARLTGRPVRDGS